VKGDIAHNVKSWRKRSPLECFAWPDNWAWATVLHC